MNNELVQEAQQQFDTLDRVLKFQSRFDVFPPQRTLQVLDGLQRLGEEIQGTLDPHTRDQLLDSELKRRISAQTTSLDHFFSGRPYTFEEVIISLGIEDDDIARFRPWLEGNRQATIDSIERVFDITEVEEYHLPVPLDLSEIRDEVLGFARREVTNYHNKLGRLLEQKTNAGGFLRDVRAVPSDTDRSYFHPEMKYLALRIPDICYVVKDGTLQINERALIRLYGHEGMGHGLQQVITDAAEIPFFLKRSSDATVASQESVTQFYEKVIFEDLLSSPKTQKDLGIAHKYEGMYQEEKDTRQIEDYGRMLFAYTITVLGDTALGDPQDPRVVQQKIDLINSVALSPQYAPWIVGEYRMKFDHAGNLDSTLVNELKYSSQAVRKSLDVFGANGIEYEGEGRSKIDMVFLTVFWTPIGFVQNSRLAAEGK